MLSRRSPVASSISRAFSRKANVTTARFFSVNSNYKSTAFVTQSQQLQQKRFFRNTATARMSGTPGKQGVHNLLAKQDFDEALTTKDTLMVLDCYATWCGPCKVIAPQVVKFSDTYPNARFYKLDVDQVPEVAQELAIRAMPTFILFKDGEKVAEVVGANPKALEAAIQKHLEK